MLRKYLMNVSLDYRRFSNSEVSDDQNFEQMFFLHDDLKNSK